MKTKKELNNLAELLNENLSNKIHLCEEYGNTYVKMQEGNDTVFCGTKTQVYYFLVGLYRILTNK